MRINQPEKTEKKMRIFLKKIRRGVSVKNSAWSSGLPPRTIYRWLDEGKKELEKLGEDEEIKVEKVGLVAWFCYRYYTVRAEYEASLLDKMDSAASQSKYQDWRAHSWLLERKEKDAYSTVETVQHIVARSSEDDLLGDLEAVLGNSGEASQGTEGD